MTPPDRVQTIAVIGAGLAGLVCAQQLQAGGHAVTVFDQAQTPGGRMRHYSAEQWQCDHGRSISPRAILHLQRSWMPGSMPGSPRPGRHVSQAGTARGCADHRAR